ncbi:transposase [Streptomyces sp. NBC_00019]|uniref:transposase n=1 Tax=Streptomyces sp. NBC_00019 TaxID=2975623 RepID=UPI0032464E0E
MTIQQPDFGGRGPRSYPPEFRRRVRDLVASGRKVAEVAQLLGINDQTISVWRRQHLIDTGQQARTAATLSELAAARKPYPRVGGRVGHPPESCRTAGNAQPGGVRTPPRQ